MATASATFILALGVPTVAVSSLIILDVGQDGDPAARGILTHPDSANFVPITYAFNPDFTTNLDNEVIAHPLSNLVMTGTSSKLVRQETTIVDITCEETWGGQGGRRASMPTFFFRELLEYLVNPPAFNATNQTFITWAPRYRSVKIYNVHLHKIVVGDGMNVHEFRGNAGPIQSPFEGLDVSPTGFMDQPVTVHLHIVSEVAP